MKVLGILGSPRRGGNSELLLDKALEGARSSGAQTEKLILSELKFVPCQECAGCRQDGRCIIDDEMQTIYQKLDGADAVILASPIFFGSLTAQVKAMVERYQCRWVARYVLAKPPAQAKKSGCLLLVGASDRQDFFKNAESIVKNFFAVAGIEFTQGLYCPKVDQKGRILARPDYLKQALMLGAGCADAKRS